MQRPPDVDGKRLAMLVRRAFGDADVSLERTPEGVSAQVYRVTKASQVFYLRVAEDAAQDLRAAIRRSALLLGLRQLCRWIDGPRRLPLDHTAVVGRARRLEELLPAR